MHIPTTAMCQHSGLYFTDWWCMKIVKWPVCILPFTIIRAQNPQFLEFLDAVFFLLVPIMDSLHPTGYIKFPKKIFFHDLILKEEENLQTSPLNYIIINPITQAAVAFLLRYTLAKRETFLCMNENALKEGWFCNLKG